MFWPEQKHARHREETMTTATPESKMPEKLLLGKIEAAAVLGISPRTLWAITSPRGPIPCIKIGSRPLYSYEMLRDWVAKSSGQTFLPAC